MHYAPPVSIFSLILACVSYCHTPTQAKAQTTDMIPFYIGTYTNGSSQGIYRSQLDTRAGALAEPQLVAKLANPSFLAIHPKLNVLYAVSEVAAADGQTTQVVAYQIQDDGSLVSLGGRTAHGDSPCYISTDRAGQFAFVANYSSGSIAAIALKADGGLGRTTSTHEHRGSSLNPQRQKSAHAHCILTDPSDQFVCAVDLGMDQIVVYRLDRSNGALTPTQRALHTPPGSGPRHLAFHPDGQHAFVIHELSSQLTALSWDSQRGEFAELHSLPTLPANFNSSSSTAEVLVHPTGRFVYGSNRGHDSIASFAFDATTGKLTALGHTPTGGKTPRNFRIDPSGRFLLAENQGSDSIVVYHIDPESGQLTPGNATISVGAPCCIKFLSR